MRELRQQPRVGGVQQIKTNIDFHTYSELVLWPYGYTTADTAPTLGADAQDTFATLGRQMAATNGYTAEQASATSTSPTARSMTGSGTTTASTPTRSRCTRAPRTPGFYPPDEAIAAQTSRNRQAVALLLELLRLPAAHHRPDVLAGPAPVTLYGDDFETAKPYTFGGTATTGRFEIADPAATTSSGAKQLGTTASGTRDLVTGASAGADAGANDIDGGTTFAESAAIAPDRRLELRAVLQLVPRPRLQRDLRGLPARASSTGRQVFQQLGAASNRNGAWAAASVDLTAFAGQTVRIRVEAADAATASLVEAAVDDLKVTRT